MKYTVNMKNLTKNIKLSLLSVREKILSKILSNDLDTKFENKTSKTVISGTEKLTLTAATENNIKIVRENVSAIMKSCENKPQKYLEYIEAQGTKVYKIRNATSLLNKINEEEGLITELKGYKAFYLNFVIRRKFGLTFHPAIVMSYGKIEPYYMLREFYKWYSLKMDLPGYNFSAQENFKKYMKNTNDPKLNNLNYRAMLELREAIARDKEANEFVINAIREKEGSKNVFKKMNDGGADI